MNLFCPSCDAAYTGATNCPKCGGRLVTPAEAFALPIGAIQEPPDLIRPTAATRLLMGTVAGLGVFFAGRDLISAVAVASGESSAGWWISSTGMPVGIALRVVAAAAGGLLAGAGRPAGAVTGLTGGLILSAVFFSVLGNPDAAKGLEAFAFAAVVVVAAAAGMVGAWRWEPASDPPRVDKPSTHGSSLARFAEEQSKVQKVYVPPTRWVRVFIAAAVAVAGVTFADELRELLKDLTKGAGTLGHPGMLGQVDLGLSIASLVVAGVFAGASSAAGGRHGLYAGLITAVGVIVYVPRRGEEAMRSLTTYLEALEFPTDLGSSEALLAVGGGVVGICWAAGWIGGQLLPPLAPKSMGKRLRPIS